MSHGGVKSESARLAVLRYAHRRDATMIMPSALRQQAEIEANVRAVETELRPDVVRIRYDIGEDWSDQWAIFFRIVLSDEAAKHRLREAATNVVSRLAQHLTFPQWASSHITISEVNPNKRCCGKRLGRRWRMRMTCLRTRTI